MEQGKVNKPISKKELKALKKNEKNKEKDE